MGHELAALKPIDSFTLPVLRPAGHACWDDRLTAHELIPDRGLSIIAYPWQAGPPRLSQLNTFALVVIKLFGTLK